MLREITEDLLSAAGYRVITAADGPEGIACLEQNTEIALAVSDLGLPSMSGAEVVNTLLAIRPDLKIIVCSGFIDPASSIAAHAKGNSDLTEAVSRGRPAYRDWKRARESLYLNSAPAMLIGDLVPMFTDSKVCISFGRTLKYSTMRRETPGIRESLSRIRVVSR
jgi:CheY-like chemotaxis protein